jgi:soluble lytic murein transglycosylase-like protein
VFGLKIDKKAVRSTPGLMMLGATLLLFVLILIFGTLQRAPRMIAQAEVWKLVQEEAAKYDLKPEFVYAIVAAESGFNAHASNAGSRGLMQLRAPAWQTVSKKPFRRAWNWKDNIRAGTAYLGYLKGLLEKQNQFSYALLAASYHQGPNRVKQAGYKIEALPGSRNRIYQALYRGETAPVTPP